MAAFPLRVVYMKVEASPATEGEEGVPSALPRKPQPPVSILVSVPKKRFHHAVDRNRMKRLVREAYRQNKHILWDALADKEVRLVVAFVCITDQLPSYRQVDRSMRKALTRMAEKLA